MQLPLIFIRILFLGLCILLGTTLAVAEAPYEDIGTKVLLGIFLGMAFGSAIISIEVLFKHLNFRVFAITVVGLFGGYLLGIASLLILLTILNLAMIQPEPRFLLILQTTLFITSCYLGIILTLRASNELYARLPFGLKTNNVVKKDILIDCSALLDPRTLDLAISGLLDQSLVIPRFLLKELQEQAESIDETVRLKARRGLEGYKKLEAIHTLELRYAENNFLDLYDTQTKLLRLAKQTEASILTSDASRTQSVSISEGIRFINIHVLSNTMKPLNQNGESLHIKIQRFGKEPRQGVGYLDDGTMVVVNGGADYIGATIRAQVLSIKHTTSGRMIFCNAVDSEFAEEPSLAGIISEKDPSPSNYYAV